MLHLCMPSNQAWQGHLQITLMTIFHDRDHHPGLGRWGADTRVAQESWLWWVGRRVMGTAMIDETAQMISSLLLHWYTVCLILFPRTDAMQSRLDGPIGLILLLSLTTYLPPCYTTSDGPMKIWSWNATWISPKHMDKTECQWNEISTPSMLSLRLILL